MDLSPDQLRVHDAILDWLRNPREQLLTVGGFAGAGKGQPLDSVVMTPFGPKRMGELAVGSQVSNPDGTVAKVLLVHELGIRKVFRVTFSDGASTLVTEDHLWLVKHAGKPRLKAERADMSGALLWGRVETTTQLRKYIATQVCVSRRSRTNTGRTRTYFPLIPLSTPVPFVVGNARKGWSSSTPIDPYVLGVLIGDGGLSQGSVILTSADREIVRRVEVALATRLSKRGRQESSRLSYYIPTGCGARDALKQLGLMGKLSYEKWIPEIYKLAPIDSRQEIVRGLMDTDGTAGKNGAASYTTTSKRLAFDMQWLLRSLGYRATIRDRIPTFHGADGEKKSGRRAYTLFIQGREIASLFKLKRKKKRCRVNFNGGFSDVARRMVSIKSAGRAVCRCITVDHPNGLYLTDDFIVTHNSTLLGNLAKYFPTPVAYIATTGRASSVLANKLAASGARPTTLMRPPDGKAPKNRAYRHLFDASLPENGGPPLCSTLHRLMFKPIIDSQTEELKGWTARDFLDRKYKRIIMDEASSVSDDMLRVIQVHRIPILAVGDHGQLGPVRASGALMQNPMLRLETIHRQAEGSSIIALSRHVREGGRLADFRGWDENCVLRKRSEIEAVVRETLAEPNRLDVTMIAWMNKTRVELNRTARRLQGYDGQPPFPGEPIIALHNYGAVCNGMRGILAEPSFMDERRNWILHANVAFPDDGMAGEWHEMNGHQFNRQRTFATIDELRQCGIPAETMGGGGRLFDTGYCLTAHKAMGSQFAHAVVVVDRAEKPSEEDWRRWIYTSATRASKKLTIVGPS